MKALARVVIFLAQLTNNDHRRFERQRRPLAEKNSTTLEASMVIATLNRRDDELDLLLNTTGCTTI